MARRTNPAAIVIFGLLAIGILSRFTNNLIGLAIPIIIFGGIYLLYKFPPNRNRNANRYAASSRPKPKKRSTFRVIQGNKPEDDTPPRYH